jgi:uncharacterized protein YdiU (UPF0061 family)
MDKAQGSPFALSYRSLPSLFHAEAAATPVANPHWLIRNDGLAKALGLDAAWLASDAALQAFAGNASLPGVAPLAMGYSGHQFGGWSPRLGDGRALLIGEWLALSGQRYDLHLKGSGPTPFSRRGDGRAALGPMLREYLVSEGFAGLGVPTSRALAVVATGENVYRQRAEPGAVLTRVARSHVRVGTFQWVATQGGPDDLQALLDYEVARNFGAVPAGENRALWFLREVIARQARLVAQWMAVGFIHGVMNTDNMQVAGESLDFGPCAFLDRFHPKKVFSSIDEYGRYAWDQQPSMAPWNLSRLAESLLPLIDDVQEAGIEKATDALGSFMPAFEGHFEDAMRAKLGWRGRDGEDGARISDVLRAMMEGAADFTLTFRRLTQVAGGGGTAAFAQLFSPGVQADRFLELWRGRAGDAPDVVAMRAANPIFIPRNHRIAEALAAAEAGDMAPTRRLAAALIHPFTDDPAMADLEDPPLPNEEVKLTFCGT